MRIESHKTKLATLLHYVDLWKVRVGSREAVAVAIVEMHIALGFNALPKMQFERSGDHFTLAKNAADRIFRWLDDKTKDGNFMPANFETSVLAAMPVDLRFSYVTEMLRPLGLSARSIISCEGDGLNVIARAQALSKESSEALQSYISLGADSSLPALRNANREITESIDEHRAIRAAIEAEIEVKEKEEAAQ